MTEWFEGDVIANGVRLHYYRTGGRGGNAKPSVVIATGVTDIGIGYSRVARALEGDYDVIMYDKRGHGHSEKPETGYTFEEHAADLADLIAALGAGASEGARSLWGRRCGNHCGSRPSGPDGRPDSLRSLLGQRLGRSGRRQWLG